jgi:hypothetical protein
VDADERCNCMLKAIQSQKKKKKSKELKECAAQNVLLKISL